MSIKTCFALIAATIILATVAFAASVLTAELPRYERARAAKPAAELFAALLDLGNRLVQERGETNRTLLGHLRTSELASRRNGTDRSLATVHAARARADHGAIAASLADLDRALARIRTAVDHGLATAAPDATAQERLVTQMLDLSPLLASITSRVERTLTASTDGDPQAPLRLARLAGEMRDYAARRATPLIRIVGSSVPIATELAEILAAHAARVDLTWQHIESAGQAVADSARADGSSANAALDDAIAGVRASYFQGLEPIYASILDHNRRGVPQAVTVVELSDVTRAAHSNIQRIRDAALDRMFDEIDQTRQEALVKLAGAAALSAATTALMLTALVLIRWRIVSPVMTLTTMVARIADGERSSPVPGIARGDEIGHLARGIEDLRVGANRTAELEIQLRQAQKLEALGTLAGGIAHEINTPSQFIGDNVRFLETGFRDLERVLVACAQLAASCEAEPALAPRVAALRAAEAAADLSYLRSEIPTAIAQSLDGIERIRQIVLAVKEYAHPDAKTTSDVDINHAVETALTVTRNQWRYVADAVTRLDPALPRVRCRMGEINQVLVNLLVNATHAIEAQGAEHGRITVSTVLRGDCVEVAVNDTGTGILPEHRNRIFDPFFTTKPPGKGTGQGLTICQTIVAKNHGGSLTVDSTPGAGATFVMRLPVAPDLRAAA